MIAVKKSFDIRQNNWRETRLESSQRSNLSLRNQPQNYFIPVYQNPLHRTRSGPPTAPIPSPPFHATALAPQRAEHSQNSGFQMPLSNQRQSRFSNTSRAMSKNILKENNPANDGQLLCYYKRGDQRTSVRVCKRETYSLNSGRDSASELAITESGILSTS